MMLVDLTQKETTQVAAWTVRDGSQWWRFVLRSDGYLFCRCKYNFGGRNKYPKFELAGAGRWGHASKVEREFRRAELWFKRYDSLDGRPFVGKEV